MVSKFSTNSCASKLNIRDYVTEWNASEYNTVFMLPYIGYFHRYSSRLWHGLSNVMYSSLSILLDSGLLKKNDSLIEEEILQIGMMADLGSDG